MVDQIKSKLNSLSSSGSNNAVRTDTKHAKASVQKVDPTRTKVDVDSGKVSQFVSKETIKDMAKQGVALNILVATVVAFVCFYLLT